MTTKFVYEVEKQLKRAEREGRFFTRLKGAELMRDLFGYRHIVQVVDYCYAGPWDDDDEIVIGYIVSR